MSPSHEVNGLLRSIGLSTSRVCRIILLDYCVLYSWLELIIFPSKPIFLWTLSSFSKNVSEVQDRISGPGKQRSKRFQTPSTLVMLKAISWGMAGPWVSNRRTLMLGFPKAPVTSDCLNLKTVIGCSGISLVFTRKLLKSEWVRWHSCTPFQIMLQKQQAGPKPVRMPPLSTPSFPLCAQWYIPSPLIPPFHYSLMPLSPADPGVEAL